MQILDEMFEVTAAELEWIGGDASILCFKDSFGFFNCLICDIPSICLKDDR